MTRPKQLPCCCPQKAKLDRSRASYTPAKGDILRAITCTQLMYETSSMFGASPPRQTIGLYSADNQKWPEVNLLQAYGFDPVRPSLAWTFSFGYIL